MPMGSRQPTYSARGAARLVADRIRPLALRAAPHSGTGVTPVTVGVTAPWIG